LNVVYQVTAAIIGFGVLCLTFVNAVLDYQHKRRRNKKETGC